MPLARLYDSRVVRLGWSAARPEYPATALRIDYRRQ